MELIAAALRRLPPDATAVEAACALSAPILSRYVAMGRLDDARRNGQNRLTASTVIFSRRRREVWMIGDCQCRFGGTTYTNGKRVDAILTTVRCDAIRHLLAHGHTVDDLRRCDLGRAFILDALRDQCSFQNAPSDNPYAYAVVDGFPIDPRRIRVLPLGCARRLVLASDGYPELLDTLAATEERLARLLHDDPLCYRLNPATKGWMEGNDSFDDRTYLSLEV